MGLADDLTKYETLFICCDMTEISLPNTVLEYLNTLNTTHFSLNILYTLIYLIPRMTVSWILLPSVLVFTNKEMEVLSESVNSRLIL